MNVIVSNKQKEIIDNANIDAIKDLNGLFNVDDLISKFKNYFFSKMILDATSVVNFTMPEVLEKLAKEIGSERLIILLPATPEPPKEFTDKLKSLNIFNFSTNINDIVKFISEPNTDSNSSLNANEDNSYVDNSVKANNELENQDVNNTLENNNTQNGNMRFQKQNDFQTNNNMSYSDALNHLNIQTNNAGSIQENTMPNNMFDNNMNNVFQSNQNVQYQNNNGYQNMGNVQEYNNNMNMFNPMMADDSSNYAGRVIQNSNISSNVGSFDNMGNNMQPSNNQNTGMFINPNLFNQSSQMVNNSKKIIGLKNVTLHAGSTTLSYLLMKVVQERLHKKAICIEVNKDDYKYYQDMNLMSVSDNDLENAIKNSDAQIIFVDLNDSNNENLCNEVIYLVEPSIIRINRLMMENRNIFTNLQGKKVVLNMSLLSNNDIATFSKEAGINVFMSIPALNDRIRNEVLARFITVLQLNN